ncbi:virulence metalloprotease-like [Babylonia areolata]|uniref:virulence metalloprotease-like n=1 Tax=Babylonia areolata TaxID=304850 RepID=UPI003FD0FC06
MLRPCVFIAILLACLVSTSDGAKIVDVKDLLQRAWRKSRDLSDAMTSLQYKRDAGRLTRRELDDAIALDDDTKLQVVKTTTTAQGTRLMKMQETFQGRTVADGIVTVETDTNGVHVLDASGTVYNHIDLDLDSTSNLDRKEALVICLRHHNDEMLQDEISHVKVQAQVLFEDGQGDPYPAYLVQYLVQGLGEEERRPTCTLSARDAHVIMSWDALDSCTDCRATGTGGNVKIGKIRYGLLQHCLNVRRDKGLCYLENEYVRVINNNFTESEADSSEGTDVEAASYDCLETDDEVNGAYSPLLDALFYGTVVGRMYQDWYQTSPLGDVITFRVHYGVNVSNAFWNGYECQYGDGGESFYPMVSLDVTSHEIAHGLTERNSNLYYFQQWGGINEAFSDMAGETAEAYLNEADWLMGIDVSKQHTPLRYFQHPELDNSSISHVDNYTDFLDPHFGSGVYNRVFFLLVHDYGLPIREVFHVFLHANQMYWHHMPTYAQAACDVMKSAYDRGQDGAKFRQAFSEVGLDACHLQDHVLGLRAGQAHSNITVARHISPFFSFSVPGEFAENVTVSATSLQGDVYIVVSNRTWDAADGEEDVDVYAEGLSPVQFLLPSNTSTHLSLTLSTDSETPLTDVTLQASYDCVEDYTPSDEDMNSYYIYFLWQEYCDHPKEENDNDGESEEEPDENEDEPSKEDDQSEDSTDETTPETPEQGRQRPGRLGRKQRAS